MAILNTRRFVPLQTTSFDDRSDVTTSGDKTIYRIDYRHRKDYPNDHIKWCRRNMGHRGTGWDFMLVGGVLVIEVWDNKLTFMYEMWKN